MSSDISKDDIAIHEKALKALNHYYEYKDYTLLLRLIKSMPNSNRRIALIKWVHEYSILRWDSGNKIIKRQRMPDIREIESAEKNPFWNFKVKQLQRKHISGNFFDTKDFLDKVILQIGNNLKIFSSDELDNFCKSIRILADRKNESR
ncbi:hypothetical protein [Comamonas sp. MYb69]|uniref:hypothetical protein n=1 Tax=Comamonas sp. MYb69 TaxID=1848650 RepID=UPI003099BDA6